MAEDTCREMYPGEQTYIGAKVIQAWPQKAPADLKDNKPGDDGYGVMYPDGYVSWSPKKVFEEAYRPLVGYKKI